MKDEAERLLLFMPEITDLNLDTDCSGLEFVERATTPELAIGIDL